MIFIIKILKNIYLQYLVLHKKRKKNNILNNKKKFLISDITLNNYTTSSIFKYTTICASIFISRKIIFHIVPFERFYKYFLY